MRTKISAESAIHPKDLFRYGPIMPQSLSKVIVHLSSAQETATRGWTPTCDLACTPILERSAAMQARKPTASAVWPIMFIW